MSARLGHVAIIDHNARRGEKIEFSPAEARRHNERTAVERVNSHLHEEHGGRHVRVRGPVKVAAHLAFGLLVIAACLRRVPCAAGRPSRCSGCSDSFRASRYGQRMARW